MEAQDLVQEFFSSPLARLSAGFEIDVSAGLSFVPQTEQETLFQSLQTRGPARFRITCFTPNGTARNSKTPSARPTPSPKKSTDGNLIARYSSVQDNNSAPFAHLPNHHVPKKNANE